MPIGPDDNAEDIHDRLMLLGGDLVLQTIDQLEAGTVQAIDQSELVTDEPLRPAPKIFHDTRRIDWQSRDLREQHNFVRGLSPYPAAWASLPNGQEIKIFRTHCEPCQPAEAVGTFVTADKATLKVAVRGGYLHIDELQLAGRKRMATPDFLRGTQLDF